MWKWRQRSLRKIYLQQLEKNDYVHVWLDDESNRYLCIYLYIYVD